MKRRAYLVTAGATMFAGCSALSDSETADENGDDADDTDDTDDAGDGNDEPSERGSESSSFDDFEDLSTWSVLEGTLAADDERSVVGSQSARLEADASAEQAMIMREFDSPRDLSDVVPALAFASEDDVLPTVRLTDADGNRLRFRCAVEAGGPFVSRDLGLIEVDGDPDPTSIVETKITVWAGDRDVTLWCDDYRFVDRPDTGAVLFQFFGSDESVATDVAPTLADRDYPATAFVNTDYVGAEDRLSVAQLESLQDDGWTVASEGATGRDLTSLDESALEDEISTAADWLAENGFDDAYFSYPQNRYDGTALEVADEYHDLAFVDGFTGHGEITNPALVPRAIEPDADNATRLLEWAAEYGSIVTLSYYDLADGTLDDVEAAVETVADLESAGDLEVVTPSDLVADYRHE